MATITITGQTGTPVNPPANKYTAWIDLATGIIKYVDSAGTVREIGNTAHNHDDRYYTETEIDGMLTGYSVTGHTHDDRYFTETETNVLLTALEDDIRFEEDGFGNITTKNANAILEPQHFMFVDDVTDTSGWGAAEAGRMKFTTAVLTPSGYTTNGLYVWGVNDDGTYDWQKVWYNTQNLPT